MARWDLSRRRAFRDGGETAGSGGGQNSHESRRGISNTPRESPNDRDVDQDMSGSHNTIKLGKAGPSGVVSSRMKKILRFFILRSAS